MKTQSGIEFGQAHRPEILGRQFQFAKTKLHDLLPDIKRLVIDQGLSYGEAAQKLGVTRSLVAGAIHRARTAGELPRTEARSITNRASA